MKITNGFSLADISILLEKTVTRAVEEALAADLSGEDERERQKSMAKQVKARKINAPEKKSESEVAEAEEEEKEEEVDSKREDRTGGKGTADSRKAKTPKGSDIKNPPDSSFVDKLNVIRGGRSLKDAEVKQSFVSYLKTLNISERQALIIFLTAISQILVGKKSGADAIDPGELGLRIKAAPTAKEKKSKTTVDSGEKSKSGDSSPIVVGESQDKTNIRKVIEAYKVWK